MMTDSADADTVRRQLGTPNVFMADVAVRCPHGSPSVVLLSPVKENGEINFTAVATPLWLTCPFLNKRIHGLESSGFIKKIRQMIERDDVLSSQMESAQKNYAAFRRDSYRDFFVEMPGMEELPLRGIGGAGGALKCLHLCAAHHAACRGNAAGKITFELLGGETCCNDGRCLDS
ncbi:MAG: DUF501 domain-containing protein [Spirochaetia bacterium]|jgi:hypothetical protein|nr:DUF501 domain-containing protein [Spirochaetia bacterium]